MPFWWAKVLLPDADKGIMDIRNISIGVFAGVAAFVVGFGIGMNIFMLEPLGLFLPLEAFAGAFPGLRAWFRPSSFATA